MEDFSESNYQLLSDEIKHLQQIHRVVEAVIAEMSFEVRTPAATVVGYADLLLNQQFPELSSLDTRESICGTFYENTF